jgi:hypothetical protein
LEDVTAGTVGIDIGIRAGTERDAKRRKERIAVLDIGEKPRARSRRPRAWSMASATT